MPSGPVVVADHEDGSTSTGSRKRRRMRDSMESKMGRWDGVVGALRSIGDAQVSAETVTPRARTLANARESNQMMGELKNAYEQFKQMQTIGDPVLTEHAKRAYKNMVAEYNAVFITKEGGSQDHTGENIHL